MQHRPAAPQNSTLQNATSSRSCFIAFTSSHSNLEHLLSTQHHRTHFQSTFLPATQHTSLKRTYSPHPLIPRHPPTVMRLLGEHSRLWKRSWIDLRPKNSFLYSFKVIKSIHFTRIQTPIILTELITRRI